MSLKGSSRMKKSRSGELKMTSKDRFREEIYENPLKYYQHLWIYICQDQGVNSNMAIIRIKNSSYAESEDKSYDEPSIPDPIEILLTLEENKGRDVKELEVAGNLTGIELCEAFGELLVSLTTLNCLRLQNCDIRTEHCRLLGHFLANHQGVREIYLDNNPDIGDFSHIIKKVRSLQILSLRMCKITSEQIKHLSKELINSASNLRALNLNINLIDDEGASYLSKGLKWNKTLLALSLAGNSITDKGAEYLFSSMKDFVLDEDDSSIWKSYLDERNIEIKKKVLERRESQLKKIKQVLAIGRDDSRGQSVKRNPNKRANMMKKQQQQPQLPKYHELETIPQQQVAAATDLSEEKAEPTENEYDLQNNDNIATSAINNVSYLTSSEQVSEEEKYEYCEIYKPESIADFTEFSDLLEQLDAANENQTEIQAKWLMEILDEVMATGQSNLAFVTQDGNRYISAGNLSLTYLNLAYNCLTDEILSKIYETILYQQEEIGGNIGMDTLLLVGNSIRESNDFLKLIQNYIQLNEDGGP